MKKQLILALILISTSILSAQTDSTKTKTTAYAAIGLSIGHTDPSDVNIDNFNKSSYPSVEIGLMRKNVSLGAVIGSENIFASSTTRGFYELKTAVYHPIGVCSGYLLFGVGAYMESSFNNFIEYGVGISYAPKKFGYFVQYSNWARTNYVSVGLCYNF